MSIRLRDLIKLVRQAKTAAEEREVIAKEAAALRKAFKEQDGTYRQRNVAKLMYMHMLGYPSHFGQMETLKLIALPGFAEKRVGYLGLMLLLDERQEVLMLVTNSLKNDLHSRNPHIVGLALCALGTLSSREMARDLSPEVEALARRAPPAVKKKALLCALRVVAKVGPEAAEVFAPLAADALGDRDHGVLIAACSLASGCIAADPAGARKILSGRLPAVCRLLRALASGSSAAGARNDAAPFGRLGGAVPFNPSAPAPDLEIGGVLDPFLQVAILRLLRSLGEGDAEAADAMGDALAAVAAGTETGRAAGNAVLLEASRTVLGVPSVGGLRVLAVNTLGRFLAHRDNNLRAVALDALGLALARDSAAVQRHRATALRCVRDPDPSVARRALVLSAALATPSNARALVAELLGAFPRAPRALRADLAQRVAEVARRNAAGDDGPLWHLETLVAVLAAAGDDAGPRAPDVAATLVSANPALWAPAARMLWDATEDVSVEPEAGVAASAPPEEGDLIPVFDEGKGEGAGAADRAGATDGDASPTAHLGLGRGSSSETADAPAAAPGPAAREAAGRVPAPLAALAIWVLGEYGDLLVAGRGSGAASYETPRAIVTRALAARGGSAAGGDPAHVAVRPYRPPSAADVARRVSALAAGGTAAARAAGLTALCRLASRAGTRRGADAVTAAAIAESRLDVDVEAQTRAVEYATLLRLDERASVLERLPPRGAEDDGADYDAATSSSAAAASPGDTAAIAGGDDLAALLGLTGPSAVTPGTASAASAAPGAAAPSTDPLDLLAGLSLDVLAAPAARPPPPSSTDPLDLLAGLAPSVAAIPPPAAAPAPSAADPPIAAFVGEPLTVTLFPSRDAPTGAVEILATVRNASGAKVSAVSLQAAVPKSMTIRLDPASSSSLLPGEQLTQKLHVINPKTPAKALVIRLRLSWEDSVGQQLGRQAQVSSFPSGY